MLPLVVSAHRLVPNLVFRLRGLHEGTIVFDKSHSRFAEADYYRVCSHLGCGAGQARVSVRGKLRKRT